tara:strand:- start:280 stop:963 length:684 start_codon:yes stop_codon:yes gene_type:complete
MMIRARDIVQSSTKGRSPAVFEGVLRLVKALHGDQEPLSIANIVPRVGRSAVEVMHELRETAMLVDVVDLLVIFEKIIANPEFFATFAKFGWSVSEPRILGVLTASLDALDASSDVDVRTRVVNLRGAEANNNDGKWALRGAEVQPASVTISIKASNYGTAKNKAAFVTAPTLEAIETAYVRGLARLLYGPSEKSKIEAFYRELITGPQQQLQNRAVGNNNTYNPNA